jgi:hypothetical protein
LLMRAIMRWPFRSMLVIVVKCNGTYILS